MTAHEMAGRECGIAGSWPMSIDGEIDAAAGEVSKAATDTVVEVDQFTYTLWHRIIDEYALGWPFWTPAVVLAAILGHVIPILGHVIR